MTSKKAEDTWIPSGGTPQMLEQGGRIFVNDAFVASVRNKYPVTSLRIPLGYRVATDMTGKGIVFFTKHANFPTLKGNTYEVTFEPLWKKSAWDNGILGGGFDYQKVADSEIPEESRNRDRMASEIQDISAAWEALNQDFIKSAAVAPGGMYGYTKAVQKMCETASRKLNRTATRIAKEAARRDKNVMAFLQTHGKRSKSTPAKILVATYKDSMPKLAAEAEMERMASVEKEARNYGMYGYLRKTANAGMRACVELREEAGAIAADLHHRKANLYDKITGFLGEHSKTGRDHSARLLLNVYPDGVNSKMASALVTPSSVEEWLKWEPEP